MHWEGRFYWLGEYSDLRPAIPCVIDPANPANNVWETGFKEEENASILISKIVTIDLSIPIQ